MSRLIDADELKTRMLDYYSYSWQLREEIGDFFDNAPTINPQSEIIRCKECKYGTANQVYGCRLEPFDVNERGFRMYGEDFCSRAEGKKVMPNETAI